MATLSIQVKEDNLSPAEPNLKATIQDENIIKYTYHNVDLPPAQIKLEATMRNKGLINHSYCTNTSSKQVLVQQTTGEQYKEIRNFRDMTLACENKQPREHKIVQPPITAPNLTKNQIISNSCEKVTNIEMKTKASGATEKSGCINYGLPEKLNILEIYGSDQGEESEDINFVSHTSEEAEKIYSNLETWISKLEMENSRTKPKTNKATEKDGFNNSETSERLNALEICDPNLVAEFEDIIFGSKYSKVIRKVI